MRKEEIEKRKGRRVGDGGGGTKRVKEEIERKENSREGEMAV